MFKKTILSLLFLCLVGFRLFAQNPPFYVIGAEEFSNVHVYTLFYDDDTDILYAGTNRGVYHYTQNKFTPFDACKNQIGNSFFNLKKDTKGDLFCSNMHGQIFKIQGDQLQLFYEIPKEESTVRFDFYFDSQNCLLYSSTSFLRKISPKGKEINLIDNKLINTYFGTRDLNYNINGCTQLVNGEIYGEFINKKNFSFCYYKGQVTFSELKNDTKRLKNIFFQMGSDVYYNEKKVNAKAGDKNYFTLDPISKSAVVYQNRSNQATILNSDYGLRHIKLLNDSITVSPEYFDTKFISAMASNSNNTSFLGTFKEGIIVVPSWNIEKYENNFSLQGIATSDDNEVYLSNYANTLFKHNIGPKVIRKYSYNTKNLFVLKQSYGINESTNKGILYTDNTSQVYNNVKDLVESEGEFFAYIDTKSIRIITKNNLDIPSSFATKQRDNYYIFHLNDRGRSVTYDKNNKCLYFSTSAGVYSKTWNTSQTDTLLFEGNSIQGNDLAIYDDMLIIGSENRGILFYKNNIFQNKINIEDGLKSNSVLKLTVKNELLFILTTKGLQIYNQKINQFIGLGEKEGIVSEKVINFSLSKDQLWILDKQGYYSYELDKLNTETNIELGQIYLDSILVNSKPIAISDQSKFKYNENDFQFFFDYRDIETKKESRFNYQLIGVSDEWKIIENNINTLTFPSLAPGEYTFLIKSAYRGEETKTQQYQFRILQPFWFQIWFILMVGLLLVVIVSVFFFLQIKKNKENRRIEFEKQKMQTDIFESKLKAIRSQMNPHFIFNSLNSIQALVLKKDTKKSYDYIEMFSSLVRKTLQFSEKNYVSISEEISFLDIYLNLESLRMKSEFTFLIKNNIEEEVSIPTLLIQPFLENAIHHGLLHKVGNKELLIIFNSTDNMASCTIIDNGIGRVKAAEIKNRQKYNHESFSLNATQERLRILSEQNDQKYNYKIEDLQDQNENAQGTEVIVYFPFKNKY